MSLKQKLKDEESLINTCNSNHCSIDMTKLNGQRDI